MPRPDSPPTFGAILDDDGGSFGITTIAPSRTEQLYLKNTNVLQTVFTCDDGSKFEVIDFCPRFEQFGRMFRPPAMVRIMRPVEGAARIKVHCKPVNGWSKVYATETRGNA